MYKLGWANKGEKGSFNKHIHKNMSNILYCIFIKLTFNISKGYIIIKKKINENII